MTEAASHEWRMVSVKAVGESIVEVTFQKTSFTLPRELISFPVKPGDAVYLLITDETGKKKNHSLLAKEILNAIFGNAEQREKPKTP